MPGEDTAATVGAPPTVEAAPPAAGVVGDAACPPRPRLRGVSHEIFFFVSLVSGPLLGLAAPTDRARVCVSIYALTCTMMLGTSALYHRRRWSPDARRRMRKADHSMIFLFIAGTYTAVAGIAFSNGWATIVLCSAWAGAFGGIAVRWAWLNAPTWAVAVPYLALGWMVVIVMPEMLHDLGGAGFALLIAGGALYTLGATAYARKRPNPWPRVFGYHEIFHALVVLALVLHYCLVAFVVLPAIKS